MAGNGPPRLPTALLLARGSHRGTSRSKKEPKPPTLPIEIVPKEVSRKGRAYWHKFAPVLSKSGVLTTADAHALILLCKACVDLDYAERKCDSLGWTMIEDGKLIESPWPRMRDRKLKQVNDMFRQFGMTPASRSMVEVQLGWGTPVPVQSTGTEKKRPLGI